MKINWFKAPKQFGGFASVVIITATLTVVTVTLVKINNSYNAAHIVQKDVKKIATAGKTASVNHTRVQSGAYIHPPIKGIDMPFKKYTINADKGTTLTYKGSKVIIPAGIFCDSKGRDVKGKVNIRYREFHNPIDFFVSGIPMTYDSGGRQYTFESAGMIDIQGDKDGMPIKIKPGKGLKVEMESAQKTGRYNLYSLDTTKRRWVFESVNKVTAPITQPSVDRTKITLATDAADMESNKPVKPRIANPKLTSFHVNADANDFPEFSVYSNTIFEVDAKNKGFKKEYGSTTWNDISLKRIGSTDDYTITLTKESESHSFTVYPVVDANDYKAAYVDYTKKYAEYQRIMVDHKALMANTCVTRYLNVYGFGIWNCDCPSNTPAGACLAATYMYNNKDTITSTTVFMVEKGRNAIFRYYPGGTLRFNPKVTNFAWCVTKDNKIALLTPDDFNNISIYSGSCTLNMRLQQKEIKSDEDIQDIFKTYL